MKAFALTHTIPASPEAVFAVLADLDQAQQWMPSIQKVHRLSEGPLRPGSKWIETRITPQGPFVSTVEVTQLEAPRLFALRADNRKAELAFSFELEPRDGATQVKLDAEGRLKGLRSLFTSKMVEEMRKQNADLLQRLERQVVAGAARSAAAATVAAKPAKRTARKASGAGADAASKRSGPAKGARAKARTK